MTARTHDLAAITAYSVVIVYQSVRPVSVATVLLALLFNQIGGIFPDIDQPTAPFWRNLPIGRLFGKAFDRLLGGHRFLTHSLIGLALTGWLFHWLLHMLNLLIPKMDAHLVWWAFMIGVVSHLFMDLFTKEGIPLLLPIPIKFGIPPLRSLRLTTGKWGEKVVFLALLAFEFWFLSAHYHHLVSIGHSII
jgi:inner membrane protein